MDFANHNQGLTLDKKYNLASKHVISSAYWKVPDPEKNLTSVACNESGSLIAVGSASRNSNLFIYEVAAPQQLFSCPLPVPSNAALCEKAQDPTFELSQNKYKTSGSQKGTHGESFSQKRPNHKRSVSLPSDASQYSTSSHYNDSPLNRSPVLIHHQTVSLGRIHSLAWVNPKQKQSTSGNILATGHLGEVNLVMLADPYENNGPAEVLSRFNHTCHISSGSISSFRIRALDVANSSWKSCPKSSVISLFSDHLFLWDPSRSNAPLIKQKVRKAKSFHASPLRNGVVSLGTGRGISIMDIRHKNPTPLAPPNANTGTASIVKWSSIDENRLASVHDYSIIKIWDIRAGSPLMTLDGHFDMVNSIDWSATSSNEFFSASSDGTVRLWDLKRCADLEINVKPNINEESLLSSHHTNEHMDESTANNSWKLYCQRLARENSAPSYNYFLDNVQNPNSPCTTIFSNKKEFVALGTIPLNSFMEDGSALTAQQIITIDNEGFFGLHSRLPVPTNHSSGNGFKTDIPKQKNQQMGTRRHSIESLASETSKSAYSCDSDINLDDNFSDSSVTGSSPLSSPCSPIPGAVPSYSTLHSSPVEDYKDIFIPHEASIKLDNNVKTYDSQKKGSDPTCGLKRQHHMLKRDGRKISRHSKSYSLDTFLADPYTPSYSDIVQPLNVVKSLSSDATKASKRSVSGGNVYYNCKPSGDKPSVNNTTKSVNDLSKIYTALNSTQDFDRLFSQSNLPDTCQNSLGIEDETVRKPINRRQSDFVCKKHYERTPMYSATTIDV